MSGEVLQSKELSNTDYGAINNGANDNEMLQAESGTLNPESATDSNSASAGTSETDSSTAITNNDAEFAPWPYTFERSISLLAGPKSDVDDIDRITKSPKIIPFQAAAAKKRLKNLGRGYQTPDHHAPKRSLDSSYSPRPGRSLMKKTLSLDYKVGSQSRENAFSIEKEKKIKEKIISAHEYRQKILAQAQSKSKPANEDRENVLNSPGYEREKETDKHKEKLKEEESKSGKGSSTFVQCVFNMSNILMGVGMLGLPNLFMNAGWIGGFLITLVFAAITWRTSILIGRELNGDPRPCHFFDDSPIKTPTIPASAEGARMRNGLRSFPDISREAFGTSGAIILSSTLYFELFSCLAIFFVSLGDHLNSIITSRTKHDLMIYSAFALAVPTALLRTPRLLSYLSAVGTFATIAVVVTVGLSAVLEGNIAEEVAAEKGMDASIAEPYHKTWNPSGFPLSFGLIAYAFSGHAVVPSIYTSMKRPQDYEMMIHVSFSIVIFCSLLVAVSGYYMFGSAVDDQVTISLEKYSSSSKLAMDALTWLMILTAFSKYTLTMFPLALGFEEIAAPWIHGESTMETVSSLIKIVLIVLSLLVALFVPSFSELCSLVGLICTFIVSVVFPAAAHMKLFGPRLSLGDKMIDLFFVVGGIATGVIGTVVSLRHQQ